MRILRRRGLRDKTGMSDSSIYDTIKSDPTFPRQVELSTNRVGWIEHEVDKWIETKIAARDAKRTKGAA